MQEHYGLTPADVVLQKTPFSFDVSVWEFFWPLMSGARLVVARPGGHKDPAYLAELIERERDHHAALRAVDAAGVSWTSPAPKRCRSLRARRLQRRGAAAASCRTRFFARLPRAALHNLYGPTEAAVDVTAWACRRDEPARDRADRPADRQHADLPARSSSCSPCRSACRASCTSAACRSAAAT